MSETMQPETGPSFYEQTVANDIITLIQPLLEQAGYKLRNGDGKFVADLRMTFDTPWHHVRHAEGLDCHTWHMIMFNVVAARVKQKFVPSRCQECWKVVVRPQTLLQLFALLELQIRLNRPSKCGIEIRPTVHGLYGGYFYNTSLEAGRECYQAVRQAVSEDPALGPEVAVLLKRACTEFEMECGPSDKWTTSEEQLAVEALVNQWFVRDVSRYTQPENVLHHVHREWIEFAWAAGDPTYAHFTNGAPIYPAYVTYHETDQPAQPEEPKSAQKPAAKKPAKKQTKKPAQKPAAKKKAA